MMTKTIPTEKAEHLKLVSWLNLKHLVFNHTANERKTTARQGAEFKRLGVKKGFPDISVYLPDKVLFVELKRAVKSKSKVSKEQCEWIEFLNSLTYAEAKICYGADEAIKFIYENLKGLKMKKYTLKIGNEIFEINGAFFELEQDTQKK